MTNNDCIILEGDFAVIKPDSYIEEQLHLNSRSECLLICSRHLSVIACKCMQCG